MKKPVYLAREINTKGGNINITINTADPTELVQAVNGLDEYAFNEGLPIYLWSEKSDFSGRTGWIRAHDIDEAKKLLADFNDVYDPAVIDMIDFDSDFGELSVPKKKVVDLRWDRADDEEWDD